jgi:hypothetical protein
MPVMRGTSDASMEVSLWRLALKTVARTMLAFTLPYLVAYYSVIGTWQGSRTLLLWIAGIR